jgi:Trk K+ transport system NAD-binding subunit
LIAEGHIILCGFGRLGSRIYSLLRRLGERVVVISTDVPIEGPSGFEAEVSVLQGDARDERILRKAGIEGARAVLAVTHDDTANMSIALDAKRINPHVAVVVRLFDQDLASHLESSIGIDRVFSTSALAVPAFAAAALGERVLGSVDYEGTCLLIERKPMEEQARAVGQNVGDWARQNRKAVIAVERGEEVLAGVPGSTRLQGDERFTCLSTATCGPGGRRSDGDSRRRIEGNSRFLSYILGVREWWRDAPRALRTALVSLSIIVLVSVGIFRFVLNMSLVDSTYFVVTIVSTTGFGDFNLMNAPALVKIYGAFLMLCGAALLATLYSVLADIVLSARLRDIVARGCARYKGHIIVAGLGNIGYRVLKELVGNGEVVVAIEREEGAKFVETAKSMAPVVIGNARTPETLQKAGIAGAKALVAATDDDIVNLGMGLTAKRLNPNCRTVLRIFDADLAEKMHGSVRADAVLSVSGSAAASFAAAALGGNVLFGFVLRDHLLALVREPPAHGPPGTASQPVPRASNEVRLAVLKSSGDGPKDLEPEARWTEKDEAIAVRWYRLKDDTKNR